jgi:hypothetical protein
MEAEPGGGGFAFQQFGDGWQRSQQYLFLVRQVVGAGCFGIRREKSMPEREMPPDHSAPRVISGCISLFWVLRCHGLDFSG